MKKVLINKPIHDDAIKRLAEEVEVVTPFTATSAEILAMLPDIQGLVLCAGFKVGADTLEIARGLEVIGRHGAGLEIVDIDAATRKRLPVVFTPEGPTESTAEHAFLLMMAAARKLSLLDRAVHSGNFNIRDHVVGMELLGKKVGVVGLGHIGQRYAAMCAAALDMQVYAFDPFVGREKVEAHGAIYRDDLVEMAREVDILSVHCPANPATHHLINEAVITALGPNGILVNASRGQIVDEPALIQALKDGKIYGAGLDVYDPEPPANDNPLFQMDNVVLTPHLASFTEEGRRRMGMMVAEDVLRVLRGEMPLCLANPEVLVKE
jgi:D-3-phosphoglycerate dehydrogenase / 2-oxoglutarate reductase